MKADPSDLQPPRLELVNITKRFGAFVANEEVSLQLEPGTFPALPGSISLAGLIILGLESE